MTLVLSALDQSPIRKGGTPAQAVAETLELAQLCDRLGYARYWLAEHHASEALAGAAPEILIARIGGLTRRIRIGSGGVMLPHYSALKVAEQFRMLETLYPGRIDLGLGRAPGSDQRTMRLLQPGPTAYGVENYPYQIRDLIGWLYNELPDQHPGRGVPAQPLGPGAPQIWLLGSSDESAAVAAHFGLPFCYAHFINPQGGPEVVQAYLKGYRASALYPEPMASMCLSVLAAESDVAADRLAQSREFWAMKLRTTGDPGPIPPVEEVEAYDFSAGEREMMRRMRARAVVGSPQTVRAGLEAHAKVYGVNEVFCLTITYDFAARKRSYELVAREFGLDGAAGAQAAD